MSAAYLLHILDFIEMALQCMLLTPRFVRIEEICCSFSQLSCCVPLYQLFQWCLCFVVRSRQNLMFTCMCKSCHDCNSLMLPCMCMLYMACFELRLFLRSMQFCLCPQSTSNIMLAPTCYVDPTWQTSESSQSIQNKGQEFWLFWHTQSWQASIISCCNWWVFRIYQLLLFCGSIKY